MDSDDFNKIINKETTSFNEMTITDNDDNEIINEYENFTNEKIEGAISSVKQVENDQEEEEIPKKKKNTKKEVIVCKDKEQFKTPQRNYINSDSDI